MCSPVTIFLGVTVVDIPSVGRNKLIHIALPVAISIIILVGIILNSLMLHIERDITLMVQIHLSIYGTCSFLTTVSSLIFSYMTPSYSGSNSLS